MAWQDFFIYNRRPARGTLGPASATAAGAAGGAFVTPQTLTSFAGVSFVIGVIVRVIVTLAPSVDGRMVGAIVAAIIGLILFLINVTDPQARPSGANGWLVAAVVGVINTFYLIAVSLGVFEAIAGTG